MSIRRSAGAVGGAVAVAGVMWLAALPVLAHHSYAMFDDKKIVSLEGEVTEWQFTNPHSWLHVKVKDAGGKEVVWGIEGSTTNSLLRRGWTAKTFQPGDKIKIDVNPLRDGRAGGAFVKATLADGTILTQFRQE